MDITKLERELQIYDECFDILLSQNRISAWIYDVKRKKIKKLGKSNVLEESSEPIPNVPLGLIESGLIHPESEKEFIDMFDRFTGGEKKVEAIIKMRSLLNDKGYQWKKLTMNARQTGSGEYGILLCFDISPQGDAEEKYLKEDMLESVMMENVVAISKVDLTQNQVKFIWSLRKNPDLTDQIKNYDQMFQLILSEIVNENDKQRYIRIFNYDAIIEAYEKGIRTLSMEYHHKDSNGNISWALVYAKLFQDSETNDAMFHSFIRDIDEKKKMELTLKEKAEHDTVTGFYNKQTSEAIINEYINNYREKGKEYALIGIDIDGFKYIRENYGKSYSNSILSGVSNILNTIFGNKIIAGRTGESEFLIFVENISTEQWIYEKSEEFCRVAENILCSNEQSYWVSVGITYMDDRDADYETTISQVKQALFMARNKGKNQCAIYLGDRGTEEDCRPICLAKDYLYKNCMMDEIDELVFLIDEGDHSIIYMNKPAMDKFGVKGCEFYGQKCYEVIQGYSEPCSFCKNHIPIKEDYRIWENVNDRLNQRFIVKDKMMNWNGRNVRFEIFFSMKNMEILDMDNTMEHLLLSSIRILMISENLKTAVNHILENIDRFYTADRAYILEIDTRKKDVSVTYEWCEEGVRPIIDEMQNIDIKYYKRWISSIDKNEILILKNIENIRQEYPFEYELLKPQNVNSMYNVPFGLEKNKIGFICLINPSAHIGDIVFLNSMSYIVAAEIRKRHLIQGEEYDKYHDQMTGLLNRKSYAVYLKKLKMDSVSSMGILTANINGLKNYNQNLGHNYGDKLVIDIAKCLQDEFGEERTYRFTGDEFLVVSQDISFDTFLTKIENIKNNVNKIHKECLSIGYSWASNDIDINRMITNADEFLKVAKKRHYKQVEENELVYDENVLKNLLKAINDNWFSAYLQPKALIKDGKIKGAEALIRLIHPKYGVIMPGKFVPYLENEGMIRYLDLFVFEEVCKILEQWKEKGYELFPISLNFSRSTISEEHLIFEMGRISDKYSIPRNLLEIEITESIGKIEKDILAEICGKIVDHGYRLSLDDFGAKYSNISVLSMLKLNTLKFDKSLIDDIYSNKTMRIIVSNLVRTCDAIGIDIVAEGVETEEQLRILQGLGCKYVQGYLINKAIAPDSFEEKYMKI